MVFVQFRWPIECRKPLLVFINTYSKPSGIMNNMVIDYRLLFFGSLFISLGATQFLLQSNNVVQPSNNNNVVCSFICWNQKKIAILPGYSLKIGP